MKYTDAVIALVLTACLSGVLLEGIDTAKHPIESKVTPSPSVSAPAPAPKKRRLTVHGLALHDDYRTVEEIVSNYKPTGGREFMAYTNGLFAHGVDENGLRGADGKSMEIDGEVVATIGTLRTSIHEALGIPRRSGKQGAMTMDYYPDEQLLIRYKQGEFIQATIGRSARFLGEKLPNLE